MNKFIIDSEKTIKINRLYLGGIIGYNPYNRHITLDSIYNNIFSIIFLRLLKNIKIIGIERTDI